MLLMVKEGRSLALDVEQRVRSWIRDGSLRRGEWYSVQQLADRFGMSRSPVREGLLSVADAGLIEFTRNRGFELVVPGGRDVAEIFALRLALEPIAARRAAQTRTAADCATLEHVADAMQRAARADDPSAFAAHDQRLHQEIMRIAGNARATQVVERLRDVTRVLGPSTAVPARSLLDILAEHRPFVDAITTRSAARAEMSMRRHLVATGRLLVRQCQDEGDESALALWNEIVDEDL